MQTNINPREFYDLFVDPAYREWRANPADVRLATILICEFDNLAERFILLSSPGVKRNEIGPLRDALCKRFPYLAAARDIHDTHKHGPLTRKSARIKRGQVAQIRHVDEGLFRKAFGEAAFKEASRAYLVIERDDGTSQNIDHVISDCLRHWQNEFLRLRI